MIKSIRIGKSWCVWPSIPKGIIELLGGSYLGKSPEISYRRLIKSLSRKGFAIHSWSYLPSFDHQAQANEAWKSFRECKKILNNHIGIKIKPIRLGHSLGCKLHLLAPDGGRNCQSLVALSFNNFTASKSIPMFKDISSKLGFDDEFSPSPKETMQLINDQYSQQHNLIIKFSDDKLDQSNSLIRCLNSRIKDKSEIISIKGDHLTPVSAGLRSNILGKWADNKKKAYEIESLAKILDNWFLKMQLSS